MDTNNLGSKIARLCAAIGMMLLGFSVLKHLNRDPDIVAIIGFILFVITIAVQIVIKTPFAILFGNTVISILFAAAILIVGSFVGYDLAFLTDQPVTGRILVLGISVVGMVLLVRMAPKK